MRRRKPGFQLFLHAGLVTGIALTCLLKLILQFCYLYFGILCKLLPLLFVEILQFIYLPFKRGLPFIRLGQTGFQLLLFVMQCTDLLFRPVITGCNFRGCR